MTTEYGNYSYMHAQEFKRENLVEFDDENHIHFYNSNVSYTKYYKDKEGNIWVEQEILLENPEWRYSLKMEAK